MMSPIIIIMRIHFLIFNWRYTTITEAPVYFFSTLVWKVRCPVLAKRTKSERFPNNDVWIFCYERKARFSRAENFYASLTNTGGIILVFVGSGQKLTCPIVDFSIDQYQLLPELAHFQQCAGPFSSAPARFERNSAQTRHGPKLF